MGPFAIFFYTRSICLTSELTENARNIISASLKGLNHDSQIYLLETLADNEEQIILSAIVFLLNGAKYNNQSTTSMVPFAQNLDKPSK